MNLFTSAAAIVLIASMSQSVGVSAQATKSVSAHQPNFAGRDRRYAYMRTRILTALRQGPNFARHYTIVTTGCGTGCTSNLIVDRRTGTTSDVPYGGEVQNMLTLKYGASSNMLTATWFAGDLCMFQQARWNGLGFVVLAAPLGRPDAVCNG